MQINIHRSGDLNGDDDGYDGKQLFELQTLPAALIIFWKQFSLFVAVIKSFELIITWFNRKLVRYNLKVQHRSHV